MRISHINNLNFKLNIVKPVTILKKEENAEYTTYEGDLAEFDINNQKDMENFRQICYSPGFSLYSFGLTSFVNEKKAEGITKRCFVLFKKPQDTASEVDKNDALGIFEFEESSDNTTPNRVVLFITNKKYRTPWFKDVRENEFKDIGKGMEKAMEEIFPKKSIKCFSESGAARFWIKNGYQELGERWFMLVR